MLGEKIRELRKQKGMTGYRLAQLSNHPVSSIHNIEVGINRNPSFKTICDIADVLGVPMDVLKQEFQKDEK